MEIIKKNLLLFIVLGVTVVTSVTLLIFVLLAHGDMMESVKKIDEIKAQIVEVQRQKPAPGPLNLSRINKDADSYKIKVKDLYHYFGMTYYDAFQAFIKALDMNEETFMTKFREFWTQNAIRGSNIQQLYIKFFQSLDQDKLAKGKENFRLIYQKETVEKVSESNIDDIIYYAIGINRPMSPVAAKAYLVGIQETLLKQFEGNKVAIGENVSTFTFGRYFGNEMPRTEDVPGIIEITNVIGDVCTRCVDSGISRIDSITRGPLEGTAEGKFVRYRVNFEVTGEMPTLRKLINSLSDAYKSNRVYVVRNMFLEQLKDPVPDFVNEGLPTVRPVVVKEESIAEAEKAKEAAEKAKKPAKKIEFWQERNYGRAVLGGGSPIAKQVKMTLEIDYIVFIREKFTIQE